MASDRYGAHHEVALHYLGITAWPPLAGVVFAGLFFSAVDYPAGRTYFRFGQRGLVYTPCKKDVIVVSPSIASGSGEGLPRFTRVCGLNVDGQCLLEIIAKDPQPW